MTKEFKYLMQLVSAGAAGVDVPAIPEGLNWEKVLLLAKEQTLLPLVGCIIKMNPGLGCPEELAKPLIDGAMCAIVRDCTRRRAIIRLLNDLEQAGIHAFVVKGFVAAANYAFPESRISSDTDICVDSADEDRACAFFEQRGFEVKPRWQNGHHAVAHHPLMGVVEIHVQLYDEIVEELWFSKEITENLLIQPRRTIETQEGSCITLGYTDHLLFMTLHMVKHFISSGMSLRMMLDEALFIAKHRQALDMDRLWSIMKQLGYDRVLSAILWGMVRYCGFAETDFPGLGAEEPDNVEQVLTDLENGGWLGMNDSKKRHEGGDEFNRQLLMKNKSEREYRKHVFAWQNGRGIQVLFPKLKYMRSKYTGLKKCPWLLPAAWIYRLITRGPKVLFSGEWKAHITGGEESLSDEGRARVKMFRDLGLIE